MPYIHIYMSYIHIYIYTCIIDIQEMSNFWVSKKFDISSTRVGYMHDAMLLYVHILFDISC